METKIGTVVVVRNELAEEVTGNPKNNKFLITALTDYSVTVRALNDNSTHSLRIENLIQNLKWIEPPTTIERTIKKEEAQNSLPQPKEKQSFSFGPNSGKTIKTSGGSKTSFSQQNNPYSDDPFSNIYNG